MRKKKEKKQGQVSLAEEFQMIEDDGFSDEGYAKYRSNEYSDDDENDRAWMYEEGAFADEESQPQDEEDLWADDGEDDAPGDPEADRKALEAYMAKAEKKTSMMMDAALWFNEMSAKGMDDDEKRYVELMIMELDKFYFKNLESLEPSDACAKAIKEIGQAIGGANKCTG